MDPPPAPIVWMSIIGTIRGKPAIQVSRGVASANRPSTTIPMSAEVPPTSKVINEVRPESPPVHAPPSTPAAGPDSKVTTGRSDTIAAVAAPPFEAII